jgi:hypothetical protein
MFNKSRKVLLTLVLGSLFVSQNGFATPKVSIMEMLDGTKFNAQNTDNLKVRLNTLATSLDGTTNISSDVSTNNLQTKVDGIAEKLDGSASDNLDTRIKNAGKIIDGADASDTSTLSDKHEILAQLISSSILDLSVSPMVTLTSKIGAVSDKIGLSNGNLDQDVDAIGNLINGSDASSQTLNAKIGTSIDSATLTSGFFGPSDSIFGMAKYLYDHIAGDDEWDALGSATPTTIKEIFEKLIELHNNAA